MDVVRMAEGVYRMLCRTVGQVPPEAGAVIGGGNSPSPLISCAWFDEGAGTGQQVYRPSSAAIEEVVRGWQMRGDSFLGIVHSHTEGSPHLSPMDLRSAGMILEANGMESLLLGLFYRGSLSMFRVWAAPPGCRGRLEEVELQIVTDETDCVRKAAGQNQRLP